jgi:ribonuclease HI
MTDNHHDTGHMGDDVIIYTDGACSHNPGDGGWGAYLQWRGVEKKLSGFVSDTTNNRMELLATIKALQALKKPMSVILYTDSSYVKNGIETWLKQWKAKNWKTANKKPVKNQDLWQELEAVSTHHKITWRWVKGHAGIKGNEIADKLATQAIIDNRKQG